MKPGCISESLGSLWEMQSPRPRPTPTDPNPWVMRPQVSLVTSTHRLEFGIHLSWLPAQIQESSALRQSSWSTMHEGQHILESVKWRRLRFCTTICVVLSLSTKASWVERFAMPCSAIQCDTGRTHREGAGQCRGGLCSGLKKQMGCADGNKDGK